MVHRCRVVALFFVLTAGGSCAPALERAPDEPFEAAPTGARGPEVPAGTQAARVERIVDGDTIWVTALQAGALAPGKKHRIRILEIDAPEVATAESAEECGASEATEFARAELALGSTVYLLADREDIDRYGRPLRYVWTSAGVFYNEKAAAQGYARAVLFRPNDRYIDRMRAAEKQAKSARLGIWSSGCS